MKHAVIVHTLSGRHVYADRNRAQWTKALELAGKRGTLVAVGCEEGAMVAHFSEALRPHPERDH